MAAKKTQIITLVCNKGGVGRSTTAINIAWSLASKNCNVLVCDLDAQANSSSSLAKNYQQDVVEDGRNVTNLLKSSGVLFRSSLNVAMLEENYPQIDYRVP